MDEFCGLPDLKASLQETVLVIDRSAINASSPEDFRAQNPRLLDLITGLADAEKAIESGAMSPRERLTIMGVDLKSGTISRVFTGCLPGLSKEELADRAQKGNDSALDKYMGSDIETKVKEDGEGFLKFALISALGLKPAPGRVIDRPAAAMLAILKLLAEQPGDYSRRLFIYSDASRDTQGLPDIYEEARKLAFQSARNEQVTIGLSEVYVIPAKKDLSPNQIAFLDALLLGSGGDLKSVSPFSPDKLSGAISKQYVFSGQMPLAADVSVPVDLRLNPTRDGTLVNSWISYTGSAGLWSTPIYGQFACDADETCTLKSTPQSGLGQRWRTQPGAEPQPLADAPFGGMRIIEGITTGDTINVRIYDPIIKVITDSSGSMDIKFSARLKN
ncbi:MAG: hypothetical protein O9296_11700 [Novosphingobium sp.]|jgi:hypothetical protein|nr:hypothetical protein [Novosphingobium sp.]